MQGRSVLLGGAGILAVIAVSSWPIGELRANPPAGPAPEGGNTAIKTHPAMQLAAHRAVYELTLLKSTGTKSPTAARGRIAFDFSGSACEGYIQNFRQLTELQPAEGPTRVSDMHSATFEDGDSKTFAFDMHTNVDNMQSDIVDGKASKADDGALLVALSKPKPSRLNLDSDTVFPTEHLKRILEAAEDGQSLLSVKVYDGSETGDKIYETTTIIGRPNTQPVKEEAARIPALENIKRWPVSISYFEDGKKDEAPNYVLSFDLYENGISRALKLDYGDFTLGGEMTSLEITPQQTCAK